MWAQKRLIFFDASRCKSTSLAATQIDPKGNDDTSFLYRQFSFTLHSTTSPVFGEGERFDFEKLAARFLDPKTPF